MLTLKIFYRALTTLFVSGKKIFHVLAICKSKSFLNLDQHSRHIWNIKKVFQMRKNVLQ